MGSLTAIAQDCPDSCELFIPNTLTPDCDGIGCEFLEITSNCSFKKFHFTVYNRWGEILFESKDPKEQFNARDYKEGTYVWKLIGKYCNNSDINLTGDITILR